MPRAFMAVMLLAGAPFSVAAQDFDRPEGWKVRFDQDGATESDLEMFVSMPPGWHVTSGPAAIYWHPEESASGNYRVEMEVYLFDPGARREGFGLLFGGRNLENGDQRYSYFLIRNGGEFIVKKREGAEAPTVQPWTRHEAILSYADRGSDASVRNVLVVEVDSRRVRLSVNGDTVWEGARDELDVEGAFGFRVNHGLNLHVARLDHTPIG